MIDEYVRAGGFMHSDQIRKLEFDRLNRKLSDPGDVPVPPKKSEGLPIPASQDALLR